MSRSGWALVVLMVVVCGVVAWAWRRSGEVEPAGVVLARRAPAPAASAQPPADTKSPLGSPEAATRATPTGRFRLLRVVAPPSGAAAEAVIAVDGLPARTYRVGDTVVGAVVLQSVRPDRATLGPADGPAAAVLDVDAAVPSATESAPSSANAGAVGTPAVGPTGAPAVDRSPVPVTDPNHGEDTSNH